MTCRKNVSQLTRGEKARLVQAFLDLKASAPSRIPAAQAAVVAGGGTPNRYDDYVWLHNTVGLGAHRGPAFGPWHREFLHQLELDLQQVSGDAELTIPYWDWTTDRDAASPGWPFTTDLMGGFGNAGPGPTTGYVTTGPFGSPASWRMNIRRRGDADLTLKRSRGVPTPAQLPSREEALFGLGVGVPAGGPWPGVYDGPPWNDASTPLTDAQVLASFRKYLERILHDGVHVWIGDAWELDPQGRPRDGGHMTFPATAVNDPVFWLHHCNVDRLWAIWQRRTTTPEHRPQAAGTADPGHNGDDPMVNLATPSWFAAVLHRRPNDVQDHQRLGRYRTDLPGITLASPAVPFGEVPERSAAQMPVAFSVRTCQPVTFRLTGVTGDGFAPGDPDVVTVEHDPVSEIVAALVPVAYEARGPVGMPQTGTATIAASIVDTDGYDAPGGPGAPLTVGTWAVELTATTVAGRAGQAPPVAPFRDAIPAGARPQPGTGPEPDARSLAGAAGPVPGGGRQHGPAGGQGSPVGGRGGLDAVAAAGGGHHDAHGEEARGMGGADDGHGTHEGHEPHGVHDHDAMAFTMFHLTPAGEVVEVRPDEIERDTSGYDDGADPGTAPPVGPDPAEEPPGLA
ncbi:tyrosinase family protein [Georgenia sp. AZ-5]|uniref:tyrosinase family protein n=1 Tax=Georgenia sp. AZ-5 TaxID=3367526 RepID=UPI003754046F